MDRSVKAPPRSITPTPRSTRLSVYNDNNSGDSNPRSPPIPSNNTVQNTQADSSSPSPDAMQKEMYPASTEPKSPYTKRRQLPASPTSRNHYETIDEVKRHSISQPEYIVRGVEPQPTASRQSIEQVNIIFTYMYVIGIISDQDFILFFELKLQLAGFNSVYGLIEDMMPQYYFGRQVS